MNPTSLASVKLPPPLPTNPSCHLGLNGARYYQRNTGYVTYFTLLVFFWAPPNCHVQVSFLISCTAEEESNWPFPFISHSYFLSFMAETESDSCIWHIIHELAIVCFAHLNVTRCCIIRMSTGISSVVANNQDVYLADSYWISLYCV